MKAVWLIMAIAALPSKAEDVWAINDALTDPVSERWSADDWIDAEHLLDSHRIELFMRPSDKPGEYEGRRGASPKQLETIDAFFNGGYRIVAASGSNQSGKTEAIGGLMFCRWLRDYARDGAVTWVIAQRNEDLRDIPAKTLWNFLPRDMFPKGVEYHPRWGFGQVQTLELNLPNGRGTCEVWFRSEEMDLIVFESVRADLIWWSECSRAAIFDALLPRMAAKGGRLVMDYVPRQSWHRMRIANPAKAGSKYIFHKRFCMMDNAHNLAPGEIEFQRTTMTPEEARVRIDGEDGSVEGVVVKEFIPRRHDSDNESDHGGHLIPNRSVGEKEPVWVYIDVGKYTAALLLTVGEDGIKRPIDEVYTLGLNIEENAAKIKAMLARHGVPIGRVQRFKMDPAAWQYNAGNQVTVGEQYRTQGIPVVGWKPTQSHKGGESAMLDKMRVAFMHYQILACDRCENLSNELQTWRHKTDRDGNVDPRDAYEGPNHAIDCLKAWVADDPKFEQVSLSVYDVDESAVYGEAV